MSGPGDAAGLLNSFANVLYVDMLPCKGTSNSPGLSEASPWVVKRYDSTLHGVAYVLLTH